MYTLYTYALLKVLHNSSLDLYFKDVYLIYKFWYQRSMQKTKNILLGIYNKV